VRQNLNKKYLTMIYNIGGAIFLRQNVFDEHNVSLSPDGRVVSGRKDASILFFIKVDQTLKQHPLWSEMFNFLQKKVVLAFSTYFSRDSNPGPLDQRIQHPKLPHIL
jgi:hypothetical protein